LSVAIPRIVMAGTQSGVGKTSLTLGLVTLLRRRGLRVQTFKVGPDYLDPTHLAVASGRACYNLDGWMMGRAHVLAQFARATRDADVAVIEGVMGLFDGASPNSIAGSTAQIATWLRAPVVLVVDTRGMARSVAALAQGFAEFDAGVRVAGVIANRCGSERHARWLAKSLRAASQPPLLGAVAAGTLPELRSRHLGLVTAGGRTRRLCDQLADALAPVLPADAVLRAARSAPLLPIKIPDGNCAARRLRVGLADDAAFHFYYADNLEALARAGVEWVRFSPLRDRSLPEDLCGLYLGGGYPEEHAAALSANGAMLRAVRRFSGLVYAECGGLMYLSQGVVARDGKRHRMAGVLPCWTRMRERRQALGYVAVTLTRDSFFGKRGETLRGHEFHYSELSGTPGWPTAYAVRRRQTSAVTREGFQRGNALASYVHLHWASRPRAVRRFVKLLEERCAR
jgi:cobyrinic acid a,c-diamide synthase